MFSLFVCLEFFVPLENFSLIWIHHNCRWRVVNFDLYPALMAIEQLGFFSVPHLLWHGASVYDGYLRRPVTHHCRAIGSGAVTICFNDLGLSRLGFEHPTFRMRGERCNPLRHRRGWMFFNIGYSVWILINCYVVAIFLIPQSK